MDEVSMFPPSLHSLSDMGLHSTTLVDAMKHKLPKSGIVHDFFSTKRLGMVELALKYKTTVSRIEECIRRWMLR